MSSPTLSARGVRGLGSSLARFTIWQLSLLVAFVAVAIADIRAYGLREPALLGLAAAGYAAFAGLCWLIWHGLQRFRDRLGAVPLFAVYATVMGAIFLAAVVIYLVAEYAYLTGALAGWSPSFWVGSW